MTSPRLAGSRPGFRFSSGKCGAFWRTDRDALRAAPVLAFRSDGAFAPADLPAVAGGPGRPAPFGRQAPRRPLRRARTPGPPTWAPIAASSSEWADRRFRFRSRHHGAAGSSPGASVVSMPVLAGSGAGDRVLNKAREVAALFLSRAVREECRRSRPRDASAPCPQSVICPTPASRAVLPTSRAARTTPVLRGSLVACAPVGRCRPAGLTGAPADGPPTQPELTK